LGGIYCGLDRIPGGDNFCAQGAKFGEGALTFGGIQRGNSVFHDGHMAALLEQASGCEANADFRHHPENENLSIRV
jgi:hypothetical protein